MPTRKNLMKTSNSIKYFKKAEKFLPGGVNSPGRKFSEVSTPSLIIESADGCKIRDVDGNIFTDYVCGLGPLILGHNNPYIRKSISKQLGMGTIYGFTSKKEISLAERICNHTKAIDSLRFVCSGTEAVMSAVRLAKAYTNKPMIIKFNGGYHGHADILQGHLTKINTDATTIRNGIDSTIINNTIVCEYNDIQMVKSAFATNKNNIAAIIVEPIATNMGLCPANETFLADLRKLCNQNQSLLIFDEVVIGYRLQLGSISNTCGVIPDLITYGKIIGGGTPIGSYGGNKQIMDIVNKPNGFFQGGTFSGNPLTMAAGLATLDILEQKTFYTNLDEKGKYLQHSLMSYFDLNKLPFNIDVIGSLFTLILSPSLSRLNSMKDVELQDKKVFSILYDHLLSKGIIIPPTIEEPGFISTEHTKEDLDHLAKSIFEGLNI